MRSYRRLRRARGFTLVELMIVVAIIGVLAALAIYGVRKYLANAKSAEARNTIGAIARGAQAAYSRENAPSEVVGPGKSSAGVSQSLCGGGGAVPSTAVPVAMSSVKGTKYTPDGADGKDYQTGDQTNGWRCLRFEIQTPQYYQYNYSGGAMATGNIGPYSGTPPIAKGDDTHFIAEAQGDLNGDGTVFSYFQQGGTVDATTKQLYLTTQVFESLPDE